MSSIDYEKMKVDMGIRWDEALQKNDGFTISILHAASIALLGGVVAQYTNICTLIGKNALFVVCLLLVISVISSLLSVITNYIYKLFDVLTEQHHMRENWHAKKITNKIANKAQPIFWVLMLITCLSLITAMIVFVSYIGLNSKGISC